MKPFVLLSNLLTLIETHLDTACSADVLARELSMSSVHLQRIFKFAFDISLSRYVRSRRLSASLEPLMKSGLSILDIASEYGFEYEQSYIRAFRREFGITPGEVRKSGRIVEVTPPIQLFESSKLGDGVLFGPKIVMVPSFHIAGRLHQVPFADSIELPPKAARAFWYHDRGLIKNPVNREVYIGLTRIQEGTDYSQYLTGVEVKSIDDIPHGFACDTFKATQCVKFYYIGQHHYDAINADIARGMYDTIVAYANDKNAGYGCCHNELYFERIDTAAYDGAYCQMEWFTPIFEKSPER